MVVVREIRRRLRLVLRPLLWTLFVGYFGFHALTGERSLLSWWRLSQQVTEAEATLAGARSERRQLELRVDLLRPESLDPDMLDEQARWMLNLAGPDELVIVEPPSTAPN